MFGISLPELALVFAIILLVFGPKKLPELANSIGALLGKARGESDKLRREFYNSVYTPAEDFTQSLKDTVEAPTKKPEQLADKKGDAKH